MADNVPEWIGARLLVVDDDPMVVRSMQRGLRGIGFDVTTALSVQEAIDAAERNAPDVALIDLALPDGSGLDVLQELKSRDPMVECIIFTGHSSAPVAVQAYEAGAVEYFEKPITDWSRFENVLKRAIRLRRLTRKRLAEGESHEETPEARADVKLRRELVGNSKSMDDIRRAVLQLAGRASTVALVGPCGSGKTAIAEALHRYSGRRGPLEVVGCSALHGPEMYAELFGREVASPGQRGVRHTGAFERAAGGTIVLDEIADLPLELQGNLLQALDGRSFIPRGGRDPVPIRARVVVTSHRDLDALAAEGKFREDLLHRLGIRVKVPGLAERSEDIPQLVYLFLRQVNARENLEVHGVAEEALQALLAYDWARSNVRGLRTAVEQAAIFSAANVLAYAALPAVIRAARPPERRSSDAFVPHGSSALPEVYRGLPYQDFKERVLHDFMRMYLRDLLAETDGNVTHAAKKAGLHRPNFRRLMKRYGVEPAG